MKINKLLAVFCVCSLVGCATVGGYNVVWVGPDILEVTAKGNRFASQDQVADYAKLKAADVANEAGYKYFVYVQALKQDTREIVIQGTYTYEREGSAKRVTTFKMYDSLPKGLRPGQYFVVSKVLSELRAKYGIK